jgi:hypothetical protein
VWDPKLAAAAAIWARELGRRDRMEHSPWEIRRGQGENLSMGARGYFSDAVLMRNWFAEAHDYRPGVFPDVSRTGRWQDVGHYTQAIWRGTTAIGCARGSSRTQDYLVCRYSPLGNMLGQRVHCGVQRCGIVDHLGVESVLLGPGGAAKFRGVNGQLAHGAKAHFALHGGSDHKGADAHRELAELDRGVLGRDAVVYG